MIFVEPFKSGIYGTYDMQFGSLGERGVRGNHLRDRHDHKYSWLWDEHLVYKSPTEIQLYTKNQLRLFINFFYALRGYDFQNPLYRDYFRRLESFGDRNNSRYRVNPNFSERDFNEIERKNIDYLRRLERMIPP